MALKEKIDTDIKKAMLAKEKDRLRALRAIKSMILLAESEKGGKEGLDSGKEIAMLMKAAKQRKESADVYKEQGREDLMNTELVELEIIEEYLPKQLSRDELTQKLQGIIDKVGAQGPADMGKVMGTATKELGGQADGKSISSITKELLSK